MQGIAAYARYQLRPWWAVALRGEWFRDHAGVRTGLGRDDVELFEWTVTNEFTLRNHMIARVEYRHDQANDSLFRRDQGFSSHQDTVAMEMIYPF